MPLPDVIGAMIVQTQSKTSTFTLSGGRITGGRPRTQSPEDPDGWRMPTYAVVFVLVGGPIISRFRVPVTSQNVQVECYGPDLRTAGNLYQTWYQDFYPADNHVPQSFIAADCSVISLRQMGSPIGLFGGENVWPRIVTTHQIIFCEVKRSQQ